MPNSDRMHNKVRVAIVDDSRMFCGAIRTSLHRYSEVEVVGVAGDAELGMYIVERTMPDVVLVDVRMPDVDGKEFTRNLKERYPGVEVVALTVSDDNEDLLGMLRAGAQGYVLKDSGSEEIVRAIQSAARGESWLSPKMASQLIKEFTRLPALHIREGLKNEARLTPREQAVLRQIALGKTNLEIGESLGIAVTTVKTHLKNILQKLHVRSRLEAVLLSIQGGPDGDTTEEHRAVSTPVVADD